MSIQYIILFVISFLVSLFSIGILKKLALRSRYLVFKKIPLIGGIGIGLAFMVASLYGFHVFKSSTMPGTAILIASAVMLFFGLIDDIRELSVFAKFMVQLAATSILLYYGVGTKIIYIGYYINVMVTIIWVIGITNAFNLLDIGDGLAGGVAFIVAISFAVISFLNADIYRLILCLALAGASLGFLVFNFPPAKVYMGNTGSHFLGFVLAAMAINAHYATMERKIALLSPLIILGLPILDTAFLIVVRMSKKKIPFHKSRDHLYLRLLHLGYSKRKALSILLGMCCIFSLSGILLCRAAGMYAVMILLFIAVFTPLMLKKIAGATVDT